MGIDATRAPGASLGFAIRSLGMGVVLAAAWTVGPPAARAADEAAKPAAPAQAPAKPAQAVKWDQKRVTDYAIELDEAVKSLREEARNNQVPFAKRQSKHDLDEDLRLIENSTNYLVEQLKNGASREDTAATFRRIGSLRDDAAEHARRCDLPDSLMQVVVHAGEIHNRMKPYYFGKN
jgi:hypothetical protein